MSKIQTSKGEELLITALNRAYLGQEKTVLTVDGDGNSNWLDASGQSALAIDFATGDVSVGGVSLAIGEENLVFYVDPAGSDLNDGLSLAAPLATLQKAISLLPNATRRSMRIKLATGSYVYTVLDQEGNPTNGIFSLPNYYGLLGVPLIIEGELTNELGDRTATADDVTGVTVTDGTLAMVVDEYKFAWIEMLTGASAGEARMIISNTATAFTVNQAFSGGVTIGDTFVIQRDGVEIDCQSNFGCDSAGVLGLKGIKFNLNAPLMFFLNGSTIYSDRCEYNLGFNTFMLEFYQSFISGGRAGTWAPLGSANPFSDSKQPAGNYFHDGAIILEQSSLFAAYVGIQNAFIGNFGNSHLDWVSPEIENCTCVSDSNSLVEVGSADPLKLGHFNGGGFPGVGQFDVNWGCLAQLHSIELNNATDTAVVLYGGQALMSNVESSVPAANYGISVQAMSRAVINAFGGVTTVSGGTADTLVGSQEKSYAELPYSELQTIASGAAASTGAADSFAGLTGAGLTNANVGDILVTSGFATAANNDTWKITAVLSATSCTVAGTVTTPDVNDGAGGWTLISSTQPTLNRIHNF